MIHLGQGYEQGDDFKYHFSLLQIDETRVKSFVDKNW